MYSRFKHFQRPVSASFFVAPFMHCLVFFVRPQSSRCLYHCLGQSLTGLGGTQRSQVRVSASFRNVFVHLQNLVKLKGPLHNFDVLQFIGISKSPKGFPLLYFPQFEISESYFSHPKIKFSPWTSTLYQIFVTGVFSVLCTSSSNMFL